MEIHLIKIFIKIAKFANYLKKKTNYRIAMIAKTFKNN